MEPNAMQPEWEPQRALDEEPEGVRPWAWAIVLGVAAILIGIVLFDGAKSETYFYEVDQAVAQGPELVGRVVRVKGIVEPGSVVGHAGELGRTFRIAHNGKTIEVTYDRALPDTFQEGIEVVAQGSVDGGYVLRADEVLVKCPSRYEGGAPTSTELAPEPA